jgi:uncharacterized membrane protein
VQADILQRHHLAVIAIGYLAGIAAFPWLPGPFFRPGQSLGFRAAIAFLIPTAALVTCSAADRLFRQAGSREVHVASAKAVSVVVFYAALFMIALQGLVLASLLELPISQFSPHRLVVVLTGLFLVGIGNLLPQIRPNIVIGIHTRRLLENRTAWALVHRVAGYCLVAIGLTTVGAGLALSKSQIPSILSAAVLVGVTVTVATYWRCTRGWRSTTPD